MQIIERKIEELIPYERNPRKNKDAVKFVKESIKEFGFKVPIIIDKNDVIVTGHTRLMGAKELGLKTVPCIVADDLTEEQIKAFRIADNKVAEQTDWDYSLLDKELAEIANINMANFGFEFDLDLDDIVKIPKTNERERTMNTYNLDLFNPEMTMGKYEMPIILNENYIPERLTSFNYALTSKNKDTGIHFYIDDYQFERIWNEPYKYIDVLSKYDCILSPDFSLYLDMPLSMKIWNVYRSRLIGQFYQMSGIRVIPTLSWAEKETFEFCFDGIPKGSIVSISTIGVHKNEESNNIWRAGVDELIKRIQPKAILIYGNEIDYDFKDIEIHYYKNENTKRLEEINKKEN